MKLITNFSKDDRMLYELCVKAYNNAYGENILVIQNLAFSRASKLVPDCNSLHTTKNDIDLSNFWKNLRLIKELLSMID